MKNAYTFLFILVGLFLLRAPVHAEEATSTESNLPNTEATTTMEIDTSTTDVIPDSTDSSTIIEAPSTTLETDNTVDTTFTATSTTTTIDITSTTPETVTTTEFAASNSTTTSNHDNSGAVNEQPIVFSTVNQSDIDATIFKILNFLRTKQDASGKIVDPGTSDWIAMAFGANGQYASEIKFGTTSLFDYIYSQQTQPQELNPCAAYPRHIMALLAAGTDKTDSKIIDMSNKIISDCIKTNTYGPDGEINDDIFALLALTALDETPNQAIIGFITANQQRESGAFTSYGWTGADITGAAINALKFAENHGAAIDHEIYSRATAYLKSTQLADGGWGWGVSDALNTSWALMGINALNQSPVDWSNSAGKNPWHALVTSVNSDGYYTSAWSADGVDWFGEKHAVLALVGKSWPIILTPKLSSEVATSGGNSLSPTTTPTATVGLTTSTPTSTINNVSTTIDLEQFVSSTKPADGNDNEIPTLPTQILSPRPLTNSIAPPSNFNSAHDSSSSIQSNSSSLSSSPDTTNIANKLPLDTPTKQTAKKILEISGGSTVALGLYFGLRFFRGLI